MSVYFAESCGYLKIGYSKNPLARAESITRLGARPDDIPHKAHIEVIGWIPGKHWAETQMHGRFAQHRVVGEWFKGIDLNEIRVLIWADPCGIDFKAMSALAVIASINNPEMTRAEMAVLGVQIEASTPEEASARVNALFAAAIPAALGGAR